MASSLRGTPPPTRSSVPRRGDRADRVPGGRRAATEPGACNIGPEEIARRRRIGVARARDRRSSSRSGCSSSDAAPWLRVLVFPPLAGGIVSLEQARRHFCAGFAMAGIRNFGRLGAQERGRRSRRPLAADRRAALVLFGYLCADRGRHHARLRRRCRSDRAHGRLAAARPRRPRRRRQDRVARCDGPVGRSAASVRAAARRPPPSARVGASLGRAALGRSRRAPASRSWRIRSGQAVQLLRPVVDPTGSSRSSASSSCKTSI